MNKCKKCKFYIHTITLGSLDKPVWHCRYGFTPTKDCKRMGDFRECYARVEHWWRRMREVRERHERCMVYAYAQPFRSVTETGRAVPQWQKDMAGWVNKKAHFVAHSFEEFEPRKGFRCREYFKIL